MTGTHTPTPARTHPPTHPHTRSPTHPHPHRLMTDDGGFAIACTEKADTDEDGYAEELTFLVKRVRVDELAPSPDHAFAFSYIS